jgi:hypothetical protein
VTDSPIKILEFLVTDSPIPHKTSEPGASAILPNMHESALEASAATRLELEYRNLLQAEIMRQMLRDAIADTDAQLAWADAYGKKVSDIIDAPEHEDLRVLARKGNYDEVARRVIEKL